MQAAKCLKDMSSSPDPDGILKEPVTDHHPTPTKATVEEATALLVDCELSKRQYLKIKDFLKSHQVDILPAYDFVANYKKQCYPEEDSMEVNETSASVTLQGIVDITAKRVMEYLEPVIVTVQEKDHFKLYHKAGFDGSSHHKNYMQAYSSEENNELQAENTILFTSIVPLRLISGTQSKIVWQNDKANSPFSCRPIKLEFAKETSEKIRVEWENVQAQTHSLTNTNVVIKGREVSVEHIIHWTMFDGKAKAEISETADQNCNVCGRTPKFLNLLEPNEIIREQALLLGISPMHCLIRFLNVIVSLATHSALETPKWQARGPENQAVIKARKREMQEGLRREMGLLLDAPLSGGVGNTTNGNTARRAFSKPEKLAEITGVSVDLIKRLATILAALRSCFEVDIECLQAVHPRDCRTVREFVQLVLHAKHLA